LIDDYNKNLEVAKIFHIKTILFKSTEDLEEKLRGWE